MATLPSPPEASALAVPPLASMAMSALSPSTSPIVTEPPLASALATPPVPAFASLSPPATGTRRVTVSRRSGVDSSPTTTAQSPAVGTVILRTGGAFSPPRPVPVQVVR